MDAEHTEPKNPSDVSPEVDRMTNEGGPDTNPSARRAGIPTLRAITTKLLATCSHQPSRDRNRKSSTTSLVLAGASGALSEYFT